MWKLFWCGCLALVLSASLTEGQYMKRLGGSGVGLSKNKVDSTHVKEHGLASSDLPEFIRVPNLALSDSGSLAKGYVGTLYTDLMYFNTPPLWFAPLPIAPDTTGLANDSLAVYTNLFDRSYPDEYAEYGRATGNGTASTDSLRLGAISFPNTEHPDSAIIWLRASDKTKTSFALTLFQRGIAAADTNTVASTSLAIAADNTWERFSIPLLNEFTNTPFSTVYTLTAGDATWIEYGRILFK